MLDRARAALPELPLARAERFERELGLSAEPRSCSPSAPSWATTSRPRTRATASSPQPLANWIANELVARIGADADPSASKVAPAALAKLVSMVGAKEVTQGGARQVLDRLVADGGDPAAIVEAEGLGAVGGADELTPIVAARSGGEPGRGREAARRRHEADRRDRRLRDAARRRAARTAARSRGWCGSSWGCSCRSAPGRCGWPGRAAMGV